MRLKIFIFIFVLIHLSFVYKSKYSDSTLFGQSLLNEESFNVLSIGENSEIFVTGVGDVMLSSWIIPVLKENGPTYPFEKLSPYLKNAGITIANLEAPFVIDGEPFEKKFNFKVPPEYANGIKDSGIDVVTLANNHILDFGESGLLSTIQTLDKVGILHSGAGMNLDEAHQPAVINVDGKKIAFFSYSMTFPAEFYAKPDSSGTAYPEPELMQSNLMAWENKVDFTVVAFHWSAEKLEMPKDYQIYFAHLAIDSGADLILGHHPHVLQGIEIYRNRLIAYSLGNFVFGSYSSHSVDSIILQAYLNNEGLLFAQCIPINVDNRQVEFQPVVARGKQKEEIITKLQQISFHLNGGRSIINESGIISGDWGSFYDDWLLDTVISSYWNIFSGKEIVNGKIFTGSQEVYN